MVYEPGDVVFLPFPYRDQLAESVRPVVIVSRKDFNQRGDVIVAAVTTHPARLSTDVTLLDWQATKLVKPSTVRMLIATVADVRIVHHVGHLSDRDWAAVQQQLANVIEAT